MTPEIKSLTLRTTIPLINIERVSGRRLLGLMDEQVYISSALYVELVKADK